MSYDMTYMSNLKKMIQMNLLQNRNTLTDLENKLFVTKGERSAEGGINEEFGINRYTLLYIK